MRIALAVLSSVFAATVQAHPAPDVGENGILVDGNRITLGKRVAGADLYFNPANRTVIFVGDSDNDIETHDCAEAMDRHAMTDMLPRSYALDKAYGMIDDGHFLYGVSVTDQGGGLSGELTEKISENVRQAIAEKGADTLIRVSGQIKQFCAAFTVDASLPSWHIAVDHGGVRLGADVGRVHYQFSPKIESVVMTGGYQAAVEAGAQPCIVAALAVHSMGNGYGLAQMAAESQLSTDPAHKLRYTRPADMDEKKAQAMAVAAVAERTALTSYSSLSTAARACAAYTP